MPGRSGVLEELKRVGGMLCVHCENGTLVNELQKRVYEQGIHGPEGHALSRPDVCEAEAVSRLLYLAHLAGDAPVNVVHLSTKLGLEAIRAAKARGQKNIYVETCPQYLMLDDTCYLEQGEDGFAGAKYVMSPPLRHAGDRAALREALVAGEIDTIATDRCSFNLHGQKDRGRDDFHAIPNGGPGVEHRPVAIATSFEGQLGPEDLCRLMSGTRRASLACIRTRTVLPRAPMPTCACGIPRRAGRSAPRRSIRPWTTRRSRALRHMAAPRLCL